MTAEQIEEISKEVSYQSLVFYTKKFWMSEDEAEYMLTLIEENIKKNLEPFLTPE